MSHHHILVIPMEGRAELIHAIVPVDTQQLLSEYGADGSFVSLAFEVDNQPGGRVSYMVQENGEENHRARRALAWLCDVHLVITGPAVFTDVDPALVTDLVKDLAQ